MDLSVLQAFLAIADAGSMGKAALRLHVSQSTLTRQIQALEGEIGGKLFERSGQGVALTPAGHVFRQGIVPHLDGLARVVQETRRTARGLHATLRIGYIASAGQRYLNPALRQLRNSSPPVKVQLLDLTPTEQLAGLRQGRLDLALFGYSTGLADREFYVRRLATVPAVAVLPDTHPLARRTRASLRDLREETFIAIPEADAPGYNAWVRALCRKAGFRARFADASDSMSHLIAMITAENLAAILPSYAVEHTPPGVHVLTLTERDALADLSIVWPRGKLTDPVRRLLEALFPKSAKAP